MRILHRLWLQPQFSNQAAATTCVMSLSGTGGRVVPMVGSKKRTQRQQQRRTVWLATNMMEANPRAAVSACFVKHPDPHAATQFLVRCLGLQQLKKTTHRWHDRNDKIEIVSMVTQQQVDRTTEVEEERSVIREQPNVPFRICFTQPGNHTPPPPRHVCFTVGVPDLSTVLERIERNPELGKIEAVPAPKAENISTGDVDAVVSDSHQNLYHVIQCTKDPRIIGLRKFCSSLRDSIEFYTGALDMRVLATGQDRIENRQGWTVKHPDWDDVDASRKNLKANTFASFTGNFEEQGSEKTQDEAFVSGDYSSAQVGYSLDPQGFSITLLGTSESFQEDEIADAIQHQNHFLYSMEILQSQQELDDFREAFSSVLLHEKDTSHRQTEAGICRSFFNCHDPDSTKVEFVGLAQQHFSESNHPWWKRVLNM